MSSISEQSEVSIDEKDVLEHRFQNNIEEQTEQVEDSSEKTKIKQECKKSDDEIHLRNLIFGDREALFKNLAEEVGEAYIPTEANDKNAKTISRKNRKPAWTDADDDNLLLSNCKRKKEDCKDKPYKNYLEQQFQRILTQPKWADLDRKASNSDSDDEILRTVGFLSKPNRTSLPPENIELKQLKDLNRATYAEGSITSVQFHPTSTAALVTGSNGIATIYAVDGQQNEKLHNVRFQQFPIVCARILHCGTKAIFGSIRRTYYTYDLLKAQELQHFLPKTITKLSNFEISNDDRWMAAAGRFGQSYLFDAHSKELIHTFTQNDPVTGIKFNIDSKSIITSCQGNTICIFDIRQQRLQHSFIDDGCINGSVLDISPNGRMLATGSMEGVVNVYDYEKIVSNRTPTPTKSIMNLTTAISDIKFNHSSEILAMCSREIPSAVKLVHFPSGTVFANFPRFNKPIKKIQRIAFSPSSGYLALGNAIKETSLFRVKHYMNY